MLYDPRLCYILDGFLAGYGILITALYIKEKFFTSKTNKENIYLKKQEETYTELKNRKADDEYKELPQKRERQRKNDQVYQDLNLGSRDTYHTLQMQPLPPAHR